jgi:PIN domain nuclease of toxin-antitoxin system
LSNGAFAWVLDASALLAFPFTEAGESEVLRRSPTSAMSSVNWSEVVQKVHSRGVDTTGLLLDLEELGMRIVPSETSDAERAADLWSVPGGHGLSLGDRACLALAFRLGKPAVTADRVWRDVIAGVVIELVR